MFAPGINQELIDKAIAFHGHWCLGLATGIRVAAWAMQSFGTSSDEEIVAVSETDMCAIDAIQALVGCTWGKGNLILRDRGKVAFSFFRRRDGRSARVVQRFADDQDSKRMLEIRHELMSQNISEWIRTRFEVEMTRLRKKQLDRMLSADFDSLFDVSTPGFPMPPYARRLPTVQCPGCGEGVMSSRTVLLDGKPYCLDCASRIQGS